MLDGLSEAMAASAPLVIREIEYNDPVLVLAGTDWSLALVCPWHLEDSLGTVRLRWDDDSVEDQAWDLIGASLLTAGQRGHRSRPETVLQLSDGHRMIIQPDTDLDPWVLSIPREVSVPIHIFVGP